MNRKLIDLSLLERFKRLLDKKLEKVDEKFEEVNGNLQTIITNSVILVSYFDAEKGSLITRSYDSEEDADIDIEGVPSDCLRLIHFDKGTGLLITKTL